ncbi:MAG: ABC transporter substrate-binding protein [Chloroflexi bacterium]|nr:ABC transporter substrate-binding protein [Chloroflexota bacterium]
MSRRRLLVALIGGCGLTACRLDVPPPTPRATPTPAPAGDALVVGATLSLSGRYSREGAILQAGYETWADAANERGGVSLGAAIRPIRLLVYDDQSEPLVAARQIERLVREDDVRLLLGPFTGQITTTAALAAERLGVLMVASDASQPELYARGLTRLVSILPTDDRLFVGLAELAARVTPRAWPIAVLIPEEPAYVAAVGGLRRRAAEVGIDMMEAASYAANAVDVSEPFERLARARPRLLVLVGDAERQAQLIRRARALSLSPPMRTIVPLPVSDDRRGLPPSLYDGALTVDWWSPRLTGVGPVLGSARDFAARFQARHGYPPDTRAAAGAAAGLALQLAIERAESLVPSAVRAAFGNLNVTTFWGRLAWDEAGRNIGTLPPVVQQQGELPVVVYPVGAETGSVQYPLGAWTGTGQG